MSNLLQDADLQQQLTPIQTVFARVIDNLDETVNNVRVQQQQNTQLDKTQTQQLNEISQSLQYIKRDVDSIKRTISQIEYDRRNELRQVQQLEYNQKSLDARVVRVERSCPK